MTRYIILFCLAGIIELVFMGLGMGMSVFSILSAMTIILFSFIILGKQFVNGRIIKLALGYSALHFVLGNIPIALASPAERLQPLSANATIEIPDFIGSIFSGPMDHYIYFWLAQSFVFTFVFLGVFLIFSMILRRVDNGIHPRTIQDQDS